MTKAVSQAMGIRRSFVLFEELAEASQGFDTDFRQLGPANGKFQLDQLIAPSVILTRVWLTSRFHQLGSSPAGFRTFALLAPGSSGFRWCGEAINSDAIFVMPEGGDFESVSQPGFGLFNISFSNDLLEQVAQRRFSCCLREILGPGRLLCRHSGEAVAVLRGSLDRLSKTIENGLVSPLEQHLEEELAYLALSSLQDGVTRTPRVPRTRRMHALRQALGVIEGSGVQNINVGDLVKRSGVSRRTLEHAFQDGIGVAPAAYLKARRLLALNRELLRADAARKSIGELVDRKGFRHHGQLAADYRILFGELPSATLRR